MALDHTRDYFGYTRFNPEDLATTEPAWFWTRWITHLCATTFVLLAGSSAFLRGEKTGVAALSRYLATRGALLIVLEATWISFSWQFGYQVAIFQVIWAIGASMLIMALLVWLPRVAIGAIGAALILTHNAFDGYTSTSLLWGAWHQGGFFPMGQSIGIEGLVIKYPLMPWVGLMAAGYALGPVFQWEAARRNRFWLTSAAVMLLAFVALRAFNIYGDADHWSAQHRGWMFDVMAFVRVSKYPPSLLYLLVTLGIGMLLLALFERIRENRVLMLFGRTPMFFYVIHIALIHFLGNLYFDLRYGGGPVFANGQAHWPDGYVHSLPVVYLAWAAILALMYGLTIAWTRWRAQARTAALAAG
jgi:uncharacterized membrane protein